jgi:hypothetical protein
MTSGVFLGFLTVATTRLRWSFFAALGHSNGRRIENRDRNCAADQRTSIFSARSMADRFATDHFQHDLWLEMRPEPGDPNLWYVAETLPAPSPKMLPPISEGITEFLPNGSKRRPQPGRWRW